MLNVSHYKYIKLLKHSRNILCFSLLFTALPSNQRRKATCLLLRGLYNKRQHRNAALGGPSRTSTISGLSLVYQPLARLPLFFTEISLKLFGDLPSKGACVKPQRMAAPRCAQSQLVGKRITDRSTNVSIFLFARVFDLKKFILSQSLACCSRHR